MQEKFQDMILLLLNWYEEYCLNLQFVEVSFYNLDLSISIYLNLSIINCIDYKFKSAGMLSFIPISISR